jgi:hypothetical protein
VTEAQARSGSSTTTSTSTTTSKSTSKFALSDGRRHPVIISAGAYALFAGVISLVLGLMNVAHFAGTFLGVTAFMIGLVAQMMSTTTGQRMLIIVGVVAAFPGFGLAIAHGGFSV